MALFARLQDPDRRFLRHLFIAWAAIAGATLLVSFALTLAGKMDAPAGGDFIAFHSAARAAAAGDAANVYDLAWFRSWLAQTNAGAAPGFSWQYPPTFFFFILPFAALPYLPAFFLWSLATAAGYFSVIRTLITDRLAVFAMITAPAATAALVTGQNGFLTAALLALAAVHPRSRPILAGVAAGLLTTKPHLGLLLPIAYLAAGCWRALGAAALTAVVLAGFSLLAFGADAWAGFFASIADVSSRLKPDVMPLAKMASPLSAALFLGLPRSFAIAIQAAATIGAVIFVWRIWRRESDALLRAAALIAATMLAAPYSFHYELIMLALPVAAIVMLGLNDGWLKHERAMIAGAWGLPMLWGLVAGSHYGISLGFVTVLIVFTLVWRRVRAAA